MRTKIEKYAEALTALNSKDVMITCDENEVIIIDWKNVTPIDMVTIDAKVEELNTKYTANQYQRDRVYPTWQDQLDMLWHSIDQNPALKSQYFDFYEAIKAVKVKFPK
jgi:hypothetical protein